MNVIEEPAQPPAPESRPAREGPAEPEVDREHGPAPATPRIVLPARDRSSTALAQPAEPSIAVSQAPIAAMESRPEQAGTLEEAEGTGGIRLLLADVRVAGMVLNEARYRTLERLLGVPRDQANLATAVVVLMLADVAHEKGKRLLRGPRLPSVGDSALGVAIVREGVAGVIGPSARDAPLATTLVTVAVAAGIARPYVREAAHRVHTSSHRMRVAFHHRYGHLQHHGRRYVRRVRSLRPAGQTR